MKLRVALFAIAALVMSVAAQQETKPSARTEVGRYQLVSGGPTAGGPAYLLDTATGKVWRQIDFQDASGDDNGISGTPRLWILMTRLDSVKDLEAFVVRHQPKSK
jgi:hypothetical protein